MTADLSLKEIQKEWHGTFKSYLIGFFSSLILTGISFSLVITGALSGHHLIYTLIGLAFIMASACVFNNYIDRDVDRKMRRTKNRPLPAGLIAGDKAIFFGFILGILGGLILYLYTNFLTLIIASLGFFVYVVLYSL